MDSMPPPFFPPPFSPGQCQDSLGVYDSGIGGLTVLRKLQAAFPQASFVYYGDTLHMPYGTKSPQDITAYGQAIVDFLVHTQRVKAVVAACNTSSALALDHLASNVTVPVVGTIHPLRHYLIQGAMDPSLPLIVLATPATAQSGMHQRILQQAGYQGAITTVPCPSYVPLLEASVWDEAALHKATQDYLRPLKLDSHHKVALLYGCTHYPLLEPLLRKMLPPATVYIDPADAMVMALRQELSSLPMAPQPPAYPATTTYYCSAFSQNMAQHLQRLWGITAPVHELNVHLSSQVGIAI